MVNLLGWLKQDYLHIYHESVALLETNRVEFERRIKDSQLNGLGCIYRHSNKANRNAAKHVKYVNLRKF
jgi:hypothetical protein